MIVGVPTEIKEGENRVALTPACVRALLAEGHQTLIQAGAGLHSGLEDKDFVAAGATIVDTAEEVYASAAMVVKVKEPLPSEYPLLRPGLILFTYLHLASSRELTQALVDAGVSAVGYETIQLPKGRLPLLVPMSEVAGRLAPQFGAACLDAHMGGRGVLLGGVPGVPPAEVVIIGCGEVGLNAAKVAMGMGAHVTVLDVDHERLRYLDDIMHGNLITVNANPLTIARACAYADLVIGAVLIPGARAPRLVTEEMVREMRPGAVIVDVSIDQGGCVETSELTTHAHPVIVKHGVLHYGVPNMPAAVPRTSTFALANATCPYVVRIASAGLSQAAAEDPAIAAGINVAHGRIMHPAVARAFAAAS
jgi:alanine dehydrogenase